MALSRDGKKLATGGADFMVKVWDVATRKEQAKLEGHTGYVLCLEFNGDGKWLASGGADKDLKVWDVATKQMIMQIGDKSSPIVAMQWSADSAQLYGFRGDGGVRIFTELTAHDGVRSFETAAKERKFDGVPDLPASAALTADGKHLFASTAEGNLFAWKEKGDLEKKKDSAPAATVAAVNGDAPLSFVRDILPIMSKAGCNMGSCHAKSTGQAGFKLSVFAFDPASDYPGHREGCTWPAHFSCVAGGEPDPEKAHRRNCP